MIKVKAPGKLYIAGEYAVVETGCPAILVGLNKYVYVSIEDSKDFGTIISKQYENSTVVWKRRGEHMVIDNRDNPFEYILSGIRITEQYAQELPALFIVSEVELTGGASAGTSVCVVTPDRLPAGSVARAVTVLARGRAVRPGSGRRS